MTPSLDSPADPTRIVILGGGFAGLYAALHLEKTIADDSAVEVTLVSRENFVLFTPMLHEVAAGDLNPSDIVCPLRPMLKHVRFLQADVDAIDLEARDLTLSYGVERTQRTIPYDHLIIALGSETNYFNLPGVEERALTMKSMGDAFLLRNHALAMLELASLTEDETARRAMLTFVVAGGGFAGVETAGALNDFVREAIRHYPAIDEADLRFVIVQPGPLLLPELNSALGRYAQEQLASREVEIRIDTSVTGFFAGGVELTGNETLMTHTLVWTAGVTPPAVLQDLPVKKERGRIVVNEMLEVPGQAGVWAIGDCAWIPDARSGKAHPPTAQHAIREAVRCAKNVIAAIRSYQPRPFRFTTLGQLATIGHHAGVAEVFGLRLSGFVAWLLWRAIYLAKLPTFERKLRVALRWTLDFAFSRELTQHITLHGVDRVNRLLSSARRHPVTTKPLAFATSAVASQNGKSGTK